MPDKFDCVIIHYDEIGTKGDNRASFEYLLIKNIRTKLSSMVDEIHREYGQITLIPEKGADKDALADKLKRIPGVYSFAMGLRCRKDIEDIKAAAVDLVRDEGFASFRIDTRRHNKQFPLTSLQCNMAVGEAVMDATKKPVKLKGADLIIKLEIADKAAYLSLGGITGMGGMPTDSRQKVACLLSGGIDSPVAAFQMMRRGCQAVLVHFSNSNLNSQQVLGKISDLAKQLSLYQLHTRLYIVPFEEIQREIIKNSPADVRMLIYRRFMLRIAAEIARQNRARFLVTGDSVSQVASQTLDNLAVTYDGTDMRVLTPLIGINKKDIVRMAQDIGTYEISIRPYGDCCSFFIANHPNLRTPALLISDVEKKFDIPALVGTAVKASGLQKF